MKGLLSAALVGFLIFSAASCVKLVKYESIHKIKPLQTEARRILLLEDYITAEGDALHLKELFVAALVSQLKGIDKYEVILVKSKGSLPNFGDNRKTLWISGSVWSQQTSQSGNNIALKTLSKSGENYSRSWDVLENQHWEKNSLTAFTNLYFVEISSDPKLLRSSISASNLERLKVQGNQGTRKNEWNTRFEINDPDKEEKSFFGSSTNKRQAAGYQVVVVEMAGNDRNRSLRKLAEKSVQRHLQKI